MKRLVDKVYYIINKNNGFTLMEAMMATALVAIAASMSITVLVGAQRVNNQQHIINNGQSQAFQNGQSYLANDKLVIGDEFEMKPEAGGQNGFASLNNNGTVKAKVYKSEKDGVQYKAFKIDE